MTTPIRRAHRTRVLDLPHYLIAGDESSLSEVELGIATLPLCAKGRIFVEVESADQIVLLDAPPRMVVSWFVRESASGALSLPGEKISRAAAAWASEMLVEDHATGVTPGVQAWLVGSERTMDGIREVLSDSVDNASVLSAHSFQL
ncbi:SIP domain-containing protein [Lysinibacter cavernae]|uniref:NADPH-dependent ferric siderophore reductase n=1 Tax=Lysinibacter cavernae TaxID=1640652 RepID=A0A7X5R3N9_9MICO|nr:SIP domain-containing protein [Lysinibacter cavernae]NIH54957.1 NADPH-dependent ferric siderophore reductase [Lysinibacter cavernae]